MRKNYPLYICVFCFILLNIYLVISNIKSTNKQNEYFRLHVVANSNSVDDQIIKLKIVKKVNNYLNNLFGNSQSLNTKEETKSIIANNINKILYVANNELKNLNTKYSCHANIGKIYYEEKTSELINMDKGIYDSVQIVLGEGNGENFWSLIFPYSYNPNYSINDTNNNFIDDDIQIESGILEILEKVVKTFKS